MSRLEEKIGYTFRQPELLQTALTHSSFANEHNCESYERLEFLGDSVLGFLTAEFLYEHEPAVPEGRMTRLRSELVCEQSLYGVAVRLGISGNRTEKTVYSGGYGRGAAGGCLFGRRYGTSAEICPQRTAGWRGFE